MKYKGRLTTALLILPIHTAYIIYYYYRDGTVDFWDFMGYPLFILLSYWTGFQYDRAVYFSEKDTLTNLYNRRFVIKIFDKFLAIAMKDRLKSKVFVLILDCDRFKEINDRFDHQTGDAVLRQLSHLLMSCTRKGDIVARWGGDEFLVLGHCKDEIEVRQIIHSIQTELKPLSNKMGFTVSASIGSAIYSEDQHTDLSSVIKEADKNMYKGKMDNRNPTI